MEIKISIFIYLDLDSPSVALIEMVCENRAEGSVGVRTGAGAGRGRHPRLRIPMVLLVKHFWASDLAETISVCFSRGFGAHLDQLLLLCGRVRREGEEDKKKEEEKDEKDDPRRVHSSKCGTLWLRLLNGQELKEPRKQKCGNKKKER